MYRLLKLEGVLAVWMAFLWWSLASLTRGGLFAYAGKESGVYRFRRAIIAPLPNAAVKKPKTV